MAKNLRRILASFVLCSSVVNAADVWVGAYDKCLEAMDVLPGDNRVTFTFFRDPKFAVNWSEELVGFRGSVRKFEKKTPEARAVYRAQIIAALSQMMKYHKQLSQKLPPMDPSWAGDGGAVSYVPAVSQYVSTLARCERLIASLGFEETLLLQKLRDARESFESLKSSIGDDEVPSHSGQ